ncbi:hypothetical protein [uncultured Alsobacter sp.]|uniref:hypothetical protein n=1 Tax=uncultured Alsobacter sp. TaxID=1748258 RepID=UPI0025FEC8F0|nr:hypothetical protein [uncultured Alsobacter sp.]
MQPITANELTSGTLGRALEMRATTTRGPVSKEFIAGALALLRVKPDALAENLFAAGLCAEADVPVDFGKTERSGDFTIITSRNHR